MLGLQELKLDDIQAQVALQAVDVGLQPQSSYAMSPVVILHILNDVLINRRQRILEFGTGISTIYLAKAIKDKGLSSKLFSVDEDADWQRMIASELADLGCADVVELVTAPVVRDRVTTWLDATAIDAGILPAAGPFDCLIVDGPSTGVGHAAIRRNVADYVDDRGCLAPACSIFIDDTYRQAEHEFAHSWSARLGDVELEDYKTYCVLARGEAHTTRPRVHAHRWRLAQYTALNE